MNTQPDIDDLIREYRIELAPFKRDGEPVIHVHGVTSDSPVVATIRTSKPLIVQELLRRKEQARNSAEQRERERVRRLATEYGVTLPGLKIGDIVVWHDQQLPDTFGIQSVDAIIDGSAFGWRPDLIAVLSEDDGDALANRLGVEPGLLDPDRLDELDTIVYDDDRRLTQYRVLSDWAVTHRERRIPVQGVTRSWYRLGENEARNLAFEVRRALDRRAKHMREQGIESDRRLIDKWNRQKTRPATRAEARRLQDEYNRINNEGGTGYVPYWVCLEEAEQSAKRLSEQGITMEVAR